MDYHVAAIGNLPSELMTPGLSVLVDLAAKEPTPVLLGFAEGELRVLSVDETCIDTWVLRVLDWMLDHGPPDFNLDCIDEPHKYIYRSQLKSTGDGVSLARSFPEGVGDAVSSRPEGVGDGVSSPEGVVASSSGVATRSDAVASPSVAAHSVDALAALALEGPRVDGLVHWESRVALSDAPRGKQLAEVFGDVDNMLSLGRISLTHRVHSDSSMAWVALSCWEARR